MLAPSSTVVRVAIVGDFDRGKSSHWATEAALFHAAAKLEARVEPRWVHTTEIGQDPAAVLGGYDGIWGAPGSPFASMDGMLRAIAYARTRDVPYLGTCAGFQYALIEFTRNVLGVADADSAENDPNGANIVITPVLCAMPGEPGLVGFDVARVVPGTRLEQVCGLGDLRGEYFCSLECNERFVPRWQDAGLRVAALGGQDEMRALELPDKRWFMATLFRPQLVSSYDRPHPIVAGFLRACARA